MGDYEFRDPIHGFIYVRPLEKKIIDSRPFQRLRGIKQLDPLSLPWSRTYKVWTFIRCNAFSK